MEAINGKPQGFLYKAQLYLLLLIVFLLPFSKHLIPPFIVALTIVWLLGGNLKEKLTGVLKSASGILLVLFYFLHLIGMIYSKNYSYGWSDLEGKLSLLLFPLIIFGSAAFFKEKFRTILWCFVWANFTSSLICLGNVLYRMIFLKTAFYLNAYDTFSLFLHPTYAAMYVLFSISILLYFIATDSQHKMELSKRYAVAMILFFLVAIYFYSSRAGLLSTAVIFLIAIVYFLLKKKINLYVKIIISLGLAGFLFFALVNNNRFTYFISFMESNEKLNYQSRNNETVRYIIDLEAMELIKQHFWIGVGSGDVNDALMDRYKEKNIVAAKEENLNAHNQYLETTLGLGILGGLLLVLLTLLPLIIGIKERNILLVCFSVFIAINFLFESMLNAQAGVIFFSFFNSLLLCNQGANEKFI